MMSKVLSRFIMICSVQSVFANIGWMCNDILTPTTACTNFLNTGYCNSISVKRLCQQTCSFCGATWTVWSQWGDCNAQSCSSVGERIRIRECPTLIPCSGSAIDTQPCVRSNCTSILTMRICDPGSTFVCPAVIPKSSQDCLSRTYICDGIADCFDQADETNCSIGCGPTNAFQIQVSRNCLQVNQSLNVFFVWHCGVSTSPYYHRFLWKWFGLNNLINIQSGQCLSQNPTTNTIIMMPCDVNNPYQQWSCNGTTLVVLQNASAPVQNRYININLVTGQLTTQLSRVTNFQWTLSGTNTSICDVKSNWSSWSLWSACSTTCISVGMGIRTRTRTCMNGEAGRGGCNGTSMMAEECRSALCRAECPVGFTRSGGICVLVVNRPSTLALAKDYCRNLEMQGVSYNARLASDKSFTTQLQFIRLISMQNITRFYVGDRVSIIDGKITSIRYSNDNTYVGNLSISRTWHNTTLNLTGGWPGSSGSFYGISSAAGRCLRIHSSQALLDDCADVGNVWTFAANLLFSSQSGLCLGRNNISNFQWSFLGKQCNLLDNSIKWTVDGYYIKPVDLNLLLSVGNRSTIFLRDPLTSEWFLNSIYSGPTNMLEARDWDGRWFIIYDISNGRCISIEYYVEANSYDLVLVACDPDDSQQRWVFLWERHLLNRHFMKCLTVSISTVSSAVVGSDTEVTVLPCIVENVAQRWERTQSRVDGRSYTSFVPLLNGGLSLQTQCRFLSSTDFTSFCVISPDEFQRDNAARGSFDLRFESPYTNLDEAFMLHSSIINDVEYCLMPRGIVSPLNNTLIMLGQCDPNILGGSWWYWTMSGTGLVNAACPDLDCCLTLVGNSYITLENCSDTQLQGWRIIEGTEGYQIASMVDDRFIVALDMPLQNYNNFNFTSAFVAANVAVVLRNLNESVWNAFELNGGMGALAIMSDCWQGPQSMYKGRKSWTSTGTSCQSWRRQSPQSHLYLQPDGPYCRNPLSYRDNDSSPWCLTLNSNVRFESCDVPRCPSNLGVVFDPANVLWIVSGGLERLPFLCEAEVECIENHGFYYAGLVQTSWTGKSCLNWFEQATRFNSTKPSSFFPNHTFCRNPDKDKNGPWCWVSNVEREYCTHIRPCAKRCMEPPNLYRGQVSGVFHSGEGRYFMNGSTILYQCNVGYMRSYSGVTYDLTCRMGKWVGNLPICQPMRCNVSSLVVNNSSPVGEKDYVGFNATVSFRCDPGYAFDIGLDTVTFICNGNNSWRITSLPNRLKLLNRRNITITSNFSCVRSCDSNMTAVGQWCIQVLRDSNLYSFHKNSLTCGRFTNPLPLEAALTSDMQSMLGALSRERFQFNAQWYRNRTSSIFTGLPRIRSAANGMIFDSNTDYLSLQFFIKTSQSLRIAGFPESQYCFAASGSSTLTVEACPDTGRDTRFLFRWVSDVHLMHVQMELCLTGLLAGNEVRLRACNVMDLTQHWFCDGQRLYLTGMNLTRSYLQISVESYGIDYRLVNQSVIQSQTDQSLYANNFYAGDQLVATLGEYRTRSSLCSDILKPTHRNFRPSCQNQTARGIWDTVSCSQSQYNACASFYATDDAPLTISTGTVWCTRNDNHSVAFSTQFVTLGDWCIGLLSSRDGQYSQIAEVPCESAVTEKLCARKALFVCSIPPTTIVNGIRITPNESIDLGNRLYRVHNASLSSPTSYTYGSIIFYACRYQFHFNDDSSVKQAECLLNSSWHPDPRNLACVPITCFRPRDRINAQPFGISEIFSTVPFGTAVRLSCLSGFTIDTNSRSQTSICTENGVWEPPIGSCQTMQCQPPPRMAGMQMSGDLFRLNNVVTYNCEFGNFLLFPSGNMVSQSRHICDVTGSWFPDVTQLQCVNEECPEVANVIRRYMTGNQQVITIGCQNGDTLYRNGVPVEGGFVRSCCKTNGEWEPPVLDLRCSYSYCPDPSFNISNGRVVRWRNTLMGFTSNVFNPVLNATAQVSCNDGYHVYPTFRIFSFGTICLKVERNGVRPLVGSINDCETGDDPTIYWQWWAPDDSHLLHVATGLCLSSSLLPSDVRRIGLTNITMEKCVVGNPRQAWDCLVLKDVGRHLRLIPEYQNSSQEPVVLRYNEISRMPIASTSLSGSASLWSLRNGSALCLTRVSATITSLRCSRLGVWVPDYDDVACVRAACRIPSNITGIIFNTVISPDGDRLTATVTTRPFPFGTIIIASCAEGYKVRDPRNEGMLSSIRLVCGSRNQWRPPLNAMQCDPIFCEALTGRMQNVRLSQDLSWTYLSVVRVTCRSGLWFSDLQQASRNLTCGRDGLWNLPPDEILCAPVQCSMQPPVPDNAYAVLNSTGRFFRDARVLRCRDGLWYRPGVFEHVIRCSASGDWLPVATCVPIGCDAPPYVSYAVIREISNNRRIGDVIEYECTNYRRFAGSNQTTIKVQCQESGLWLPNPVTFACHLYGCLPVETLRNRYPATSISGDHSNVGAQIFVTCNRGHIMRDQSLQVLATCQSDRFWYPRETGFECLPITCGGAPPVVSNAVVSTPNGSGFGAIALVICNRGFIIQNLQTNRIGITCDINGAWMPRSSSLNCVPSFCITLPTLPHRSFQPNYTNPRAEVNATGLVTCDRGYWLKPDVYNFTVTCDATGQWLPTPNCVPVTCVEPEILKNADRFFMGSIVTNTRLVFQQQIEYRCRASFWVTPGMRTQRSRCLMDGTWTHSRGTRALRPCIPISCPKLPVVPFADIVAVANASVAVQVVGVQVTYQCRRGRRFSGSQASTFTVTCAGDSTWQPSPFNLQCLTTLCPTLPLFVKSSDAVEFGSTVTLSCPVGFSAIAFNDQFTVTCTISRVWQPLASFPDFCKRTECRPPPNFANAVVRTLNANQSFFPGDTGRVECLNSYTVSLTSNFWIITCDSSREWVPDDLQCISTNSFSCDLPPSIDNAVRSLPNTYIDGETVTYTCNRHYWLPNDRIEITLTCINGLWGPDPLNTACTPVTCADPGLPSTVRGEIARPANLSTFTPTTSATGRIFYGEGTVVDFICQSGFWMANTRVSLRSECVFGDFQPDPRQLLCTDQLCGEPLPDIQMAAIEVYVNAASLPEARYTCNENYILSPAFLMRSRQLTTSCISNAWSPSPLDYQCIPLLCSTPPTIVNGYYMSGMLSLNSTVIYRCESGYEFAFSNETLNTTCSANGNWDPEPRRFACSRVDCGAPVAIENVLLTFSVTRYLNTARYTCRLGQRIEARPSRFVEVVCQLLPEDGSMMRRLNHTGSVAQWVGVVLTTTMITRSWFDSHRSHVVASLDKMLHDDYLCLLDFDKQQIKDGDRRWSPEPVNAARCVDMTCDGELPNLPNTHYSFGSITAGSFRTYVCRRGYSISPGITTLSIMCRSDGTWSTSADRCTLSQCNRPPLVAGATVLSYNRIIDIHGDVQENATYRCDNATWISDGFYKSFTFSTRCVNGAWNPNPTVDLRCVPVTCDVLPSPRNLQGAEPPEIIRSLPELAPVVGSTVQYNCPFGQFVKAERRRRVFTKCQDDGTWTIDAQLVFCQQVFCPLSYEDQYGAWTHQNSFTVGSRSQIICSPLFRLGVGMTSLILECSENGRWEPNLKCLPIACPDPNITNAVYNVTGTSMDIVAFPASSQVDVGCQDGYTISMISRLTCQVNGFWVPPPSLIKCNPNQCPLPSTPANAILVGRRGFNQTLFATCRSGFTVRPGVASVGSLCRIDGSWNVDLSAVVCLPAQCTSLGTIQFGSINPQSPNLQYQSGVTIQAACFQGYWFRRDVSTMFIRCGGSGMWDPFIDNLACTRITCPLPKEIRHATSTPSDRFVGNRLYYECDPLYWVALRISMSMEDQIFYRWILRPIRSIELTCTMSGNWNIDPEMLYCLSSTEVNSYEIRNEVAIQALPFDNVALRPIGAFKWLNRNAFVALSGPGNGSELRLWITRLASNARRRLNLDGLRELQNSLRDQRFRFVLRDIINLARSNSINCSSNSSSNRQCFTTLTTMRLLSGARNLVSLNEQYLSQIVATALDARNTRITNTISRSFNSYAIFTTSNISALIDGDPLRSWTPNPHALTWQFEMHMGSLYSIREIMMTSINHTVFNVTLSSNNQTFSSVTFGPINTRNPGALSNKIRVSLLQTTYGLQIMLSDFGDLPAVLVRFAFDFPPVIGEVNILAAPASWLIYASPLAFHIILLGILIFFCVLLPITMVFDFRHLKECSVQWFGGFKEGIPCILKIRTAVAPRKPVDVFVRVITSGDSRTPVAWIKYRVNRLSILGNNLTLGFFVPRPVTDYLGVYMLCTSAKHQEHVHGNPQAILWKIREFGALCNGNFWFHYRNKPYLELNTNQRYGFSLQNQHPIRKDIYLSWFSTFAQHHVLTFFRPRRKLFSYQYFTLTQRLFSIVAALSTSLFLFAILYVYSGILGDSEEVAWFGNRFFAISTRSAVCALLAFGGGIFVLALLRITFIGMSKKERKAKLIGKNPPSKDNYREASYPRTQQRSLGESRCRVAIDLDSKNKDNQEMAAQGRTAILPVPGRTVYNMIMTGSPSLQRLHEVKSSSHKTDKPTLTSLLPSTSQMILWLMERNFKKIPTESRSYGVIAPSAGYARSNDSRGGFNDKDNTSTSKKVGFEMDQVEDNNEILSPRIHVKSGANVQGCISVNEVDYWRKQRVSLSNTQLPVFKKRPSYFSGHKLKRSVIEPSAALDKDRRSTSISGWLKQRMVDIPKRLSVASSSKSPSDAIASSSAGEDIEQASPDPVRSSSQIEIKSSLRKGLQKHDWPEDDNDPKPGTRFPDEEPPSFAKRFLDQESNRERRRSYLNNADLAKNFQIEASLSNRKSSLKQAAPTQSDIPQSLTGRDENLDKDYSQLSQKRGNNYSSRRDDRDAPTSRYDDRGGPPSRYDDRDDYRSRYDDRDGPSSRYDDRDDYRLRYDDRDDYRFRYDDRDDYPSRYDDRDDYRSRYDDDRDGPPSRYDDRDVPYGYNSPHLEDDRPSHERLQLPPRYLERLYTKDVDQLPTDSSDAAAFFDSDSTNIHEFSSSPVVEDDVEDSSQFDDSLLSSYDDDGMIPIDDPRVKRKKQRKKPRKKPLREQLNTLDSEPDVIKEVTYYMKPKVVAKQNLKYLHGGESDSKLLDYVKAHQKRKFGKKSNYSPLAIGDSEDVSSSPADRFQTAKHTKQQRGKPPFKDKIPKEFPDTSSSLKSSDNLGDAQQNKKPTADKLLLDSEKADVQPVGREDQPVDQGSAVVMDTLSPHLSDANAFLQKSEDVLTAIIERLAYQRDQKQNVQSTSEQTFDNKGKQRSAVSSEELLRRPVTDSELLEMHKRIKKYRNLVSGQDEDDFKPHEENSIEEVRNYVARLAYQTRETLREKSKSLLPPDDQGRSGRQLRSPSISLLRPGEQSRSGFQLGASSTSLLRLGEQSRSGIQLGAPSTSLLLPGEQSRSGLLDDKAWSNLALDGRSRLNQPVKSDDHIITSPFLSRELVNKPVSKNELNLMYDQVLKVRSYVESDDMDEEEPQIDPYEHSMYHYTAPISFSPDDFIDASEQLDLGKKDKKNVDDAGNRGQSKDYAISRPTASQLAIATGRRTIYPQRNELLTHFTMADFCTFTPTSCLLLVVAVTSALMLVLCHDINANNNTGQSGKYMLDTLILLFIATLILGTSIEAFFVSFLVYFGNVHLDIDFEDEVTKLLKKYQGKPSKFVDVKQGVTRSNVSLDEFFDVNESFPLEAAYNSRAAGKTIGVQSEIRSSAKKAREKLYRDRIAISKERVLYPRRAASTPAIIPLSGSENQRIPLKVTRQESLEIIPIVDSQLEAVANTALETSMTSVKSDTSFITALPCQSISLCSICVGDEIEAEEGWFSRWLFDNFRSRRYPCSAICEKMEPRERLNCAVTQIPSKFDVKKINVSDEMCPYIQEKELNLTPSKFNNLPNEICPYIQEKELNLTPSKFNNLPNEICPYIQEKEFNLTPFNQKAKPSAPVTRHLDPSLQSYHDSSNRSMNKNFLTKDRDIREFEQPHLSQHNALPLISSGNIFRKQRFKRKKFAKYVGLNRSSSENSVFRSSLKMPFKFQSSTSYIGSVRHLQFDCDLIPKYEDFKSTSHQHASSKPFVTGKKFQKSHHYSKQLESKIRQNYHEQGETSSKMSPDVIVKRSENKETVAQFQHVSVSPQNAKKVVANDKLPSRLKVLCHGIDGETEVKVAYTDSKNPALLDPQSKQQVSDLKPDQSMMSENSVIKVTHYTFPFQQESGEKRGRKLHKLLEKSVQDNQPELCNTSKAAYGGIQSVVVNEISENASEKIPSPQMHAKKVNFADKLTRNTSGTLFDIDYGVVSKKPLEKMQQDSTSTSSISDSSSHISTSETSACFTTENSEGSSTEEDRFSTASAETIIRKNDSLTEIRELLKMFIDIRESIQECVGYKEAGRFSALQPSAGPIKQETVSAAMSCLVLTGSLSETILPSLTGNETDASSLTEIAALKDEMENVQVTAEKYLQVDRDDVPSSTQARCNIEDVAQLRKRFNRLCNTVKEANEM